MSGWEIFTWLSTIILGLGSLIVFIFFLLDLPSLLNNQPKKMLEEMGESPFEQGGYFIIKGKEKVILSQERMAMNKLYLVKKKPDSFNSYVVEIK